VRPSRLSRRRPGQPHSTHPRLPSLGEPTSGPQPEVVAQRGAGPANEPARLAIVTALASCEQAEFLFLQRLTGLSKGNLSSHLSKLEAAGLVTIVKWFEGKVSHTSAQLTTDGVEAIERYWERLAELRRNINHWRPAP